MKCDHPLEIFAPKSYQDRFGQHSLTTSGGSGTTPYIFAWKVSASMVFLLEWIQIFYTYATVHSASGADCDTLIVEPVFPQAPPDDAAMNITVADRAALKFDYLAVFNPGSQFYFKCGVTRAANPAGRLCFAWKGRAWMDVERKWNVGEKLTTAATKTWEI